MTIRGVALLIVLAGVAICTTIRWRNRLWLARDRSETLLGLRDAFRFVETEYGMSCTRERYDAEAFGNAYVDYEGHGRILRVVKDRGQFLFSLGTSDRSYLVEGQLLKRCGATADLDELVRAEWRSLPLLAATARRHFKHFLASVLVDLANAQKDTGSLE